VGVPDPNDVAAYDELEKRLIGGPRPLSGPIELRDYDPCWPNRYAERASRVRAALGERAVRIDHVGSTSVSGLVAKPIIDIVLEVPDSADEAAYVGDLEAAGYLLRIREPDWFEHRLFNTAGQDVNLHVFSAGCSETERMVRFRDWLRANTLDRELYVRTKRELAARDWKYMQQYADAKTDVVEQIMTRAMAGRERSQLPAPRICVPWRWALNARGRQHRHCRCARELKLSLARAFSAVVGGALEVDRDR
jgi:GrpB-like predicted nucleotidyltransferase (UPF0157 family)